MVLEQCRVVLEPVDLSGSKPSRPRSTCVMLTLATYLSSGVSMWLIVLGLLFASPATRYLDFPLMEDARALADKGRFESPKTYKKTLAFYRYMVGNNGSLRWKTVVNLPHIRARHIENRDRGSAWEGVNIYEYKGRVRIYVIPRKGTEAHHK
jgi:hypothetical protein